MDHFPSDLIPLPTMPYDTRPVELPLDIEECRTALWASRGNISEAALRLKITPLRLRKFVEKSPRLMEEQREAQDQLLDQSESQMADALADKADAQRADNAAKFILTNLGARRGYGTKGSGIVLNPEGKSGSVKITWGDGEDFNVPSHAGATIDHDG